MAAMTDAETATATTFEALASALDVDVTVVRARLNELTACELARTRPDGRIRVTITGEEFFGLPIDSRVIVDASRKAAERQ